MFGLMRHPRNLRQCTAFLGEAMKINQARCTNLSTSRSASTASKKSSISAYSDSSQTLEGIRTFPAYNVYRGKSAMTLQVIKPIWERTPTGSGLRIKSQGTLLLSFANARGTREYDWDNKELFSLSPTECGEIVAAIEQSREYSAFHDPNMLGPDQGQVTKALQMNPSNDGKGGMFMSLRVTKGGGGGGGGTISLSLSPGELYTIKTLMTFSIPRLLGFDELFGETPRILTTEEMPPF